MVSLQYPGIRVDAILQKLAMNKTVRDLDVKCTIFISEEGNRHNQYMVGATC